MNLSGKRWMALRTISRLAPHPLPNSLPNSMGITYSAMFSSCANWRSGPGLGIPACPGREGPWVIQNLAPSSVPEPSARNPLTPPGPRPRGDNQYTEMLKSLSQDLTPSFVLSQDLTPSFVVSG